MLLQKFTKIFKKIVGSKNESKENKPYWAVISTKQPKCVYYFGPFDTYTEAEANHQGYIDDLVGEKAIGIEVKIERCNPTILTIDEESTASNQTKH